MADRDHYVAIRVTADEKAMIEALAEDSGLSQSDVVRQLVRTAYREKFPTTPAKTKKPTK